MLEKGKISGFQLVLLMHPTIMASGLILMPSITAIQAKQDIWLSPIMASVIGYLNVYLVYRLNKLYPGKTIIEYAPRIVGYRILQRLSADRIFGTVFD
ncbi:GerAB/ArcD/ProY family transporter [Cohnella soli]|uniref:GerAB/ArcD/ProY family transporter n=1 Tax=Cohnella soli TaxID=425005 RepID=A0ABW0I016_9BACL